MLEPVEKVPKDNFNLKDMSPEEKAFYATSMTESQKEWKGKQNKVVSCGIWNSCKHTDVPFILCLDFVYKFIVNL